MDLKFPSYYYDYIYATLGTHRVYKRNHLISRSTSASTHTHTHTHIKELYANNRETSITPVCAHTHILRNFMQTAGKQGSHQQIKSSDIVRIQEQESGWLLPTTRESSI